MARFLLVAAVILIAFSNLSSSSPKSRGGDTAAKLSDVEHHVDGEHDPQYDHDAFLGKEDSKTFDQLSPEESKKRLLIIVKKIDKNNDDFVTEQELKDWVQYIHEKYLWEDTDKQWKDWGHLIVNEILSWSQYLWGTYGHKTETEIEEIPGYDYRELLKRDKRRWKLADEDGDNQLTRNEFNSFLHPAEVEHMMDSYIQDTLEQMDTNKDGFVSKEEYLNDLYPPSEREKDPEEPDWFKEERTHFGEYRDENKDGKMDKKELKHWMIPDGYSMFDAEAQHLMFHADSDKDHKLTEKEIIDKYDVFVGSQATKFGEALTKHDEL